MKRNTILYRIFSLAVASILTIASQAQSFETSKIIEKSEKVSQNVTIDFSNYSADLNIVTTNGNEINICTEITVDAKTQEDAGKFIRAVEDFEFEVSDKNAQINTRFYQKMQSINGRITMTLKNGDKIKLRDYDIKHKLEIPASANLKMQNKYSDMQLGALTGKASFNLYNCELDAETFTETVEINAKYSKIRVDKFDADLELNFYDSDLNFETAKNIKATCKYSKLQGESAESLNLNSYDDKFFINSISDLKITAKYSDLVAKAKLNSCSLNLYDSNITISSAALVKFNGKYCTLDLGDVENFSISNSYDNVIQTKTVGQLEALVSKYSKMSIEQIKKFSIIDRKSVV